LESFLLVSRPLAAVLGRPPCAVRPPSVPRAAISCGPGSAPTAQLLQFRIGMPKNPRVARSG